MLPLLPIPQSQAESCPLDGLQIYTETCPWLSEDSTTELLISVIYAKNRPWHLGWDQAEAEQSS